MNNDELIKRVERETRYLIGDQAVQIMVLRAALELQQSQQPTEQPPEKPTKPVPNPAPPPPEKPGHPGPSPDIPPPPPTRSPVPDPARDKSNGHYQEKIAG